MDATSLSTAPDFQGMPLFPPHIEEGASLHMHSRGERVAIVDDEKIVLSVTEQVLGRLGYVTTAYHSTARCLKAFASGTADFDLLITDLAMPEMTGLDLTRRLRLSGHELPVLIMTGFSKHLRPTAVQGLGRVALLKKPFTRAHLGQSVRRLLSSYSASLA